MCKIVNPGLHPELVNTTELRLKSVEPCCGLPNPFGVGLHLGVNRFVFVDGLVEFFHSRDRLCRFGNYTRGYGGSGGRALRFGPRVLRLCVTRISSTEEGVRKNELGNLRL